MGVETEPARITAADADEVQYVRKLLTLYMRVKVPRVPTGRKQEPRRTLWQYFMTSWISDLLRVGYLRGVTNNDFWTLGPQHQTETWRAKFQDARRRQNGPGATQLVYTIMRTFWFRLFVATFFITASTAVSAVNPLLLQQLIEIVEEGGQGSPGKGIGFAIGYTGLTYVSGYFQSYYTYVAMTTVELVRSVLVSEIYTHALTLDTEAQQKFTKAKITTYTSSDTLRVMTGLRMAPYAVSAFVSIATATGVLIHTIGVAPSLPGIGFIVIALALNAAFSKYLSVPFRAKSMPFAESRISLLTELVSHIRSIKMFGLEKLYKESINIKRWKELVQLRKLKYVESIFQAFITRVSYFASVIAFVIMIALNHNIPPSKAFPAFSLFQEFSPALAMLSMGFAAAADAYVALKRIAEFLDTKAAESYLVLSSEPEKAVVIKDGSFQWTQPLEQVAESTEPAEPVESKEPVFKLRNVNVEVTSGQLAVVIGSVGRGKTSVLQAILGNMFKTSGEVLISTTSLSASIEPWMMSGTLRDNILFGEDYDDARFWSVVKACGLEKDLQEFDDGELTFVGEKGVTLSGGQKARVSLARAVYKRCDIVILDDVLSAVDSKVSRVIIDQCLTGILRDRTVILATNNINVATKADTVIFIDNSGVIHQGTFSELCETLPEVSALATSQSAKQGDVATSTEITEIDEKGSLDDAPSAGLKKNAMVMEEEKKREGKFSPAMFKAYLTACGTFSSYFWLSQVVLFSIIGSAAHAWLSIWLSYWTGDVFPFSNGAYIGGYVGIAVFEAVTEFVICIAMTIFNTDISYTLHSEGIVSLLKAPVAFFDRNPAGRIINRFTEDMVHIDTNLYMALLQMILVVCLFISQAVTVFVFQPFAAIAIPPILVLLFLVLGYYQSCSREIRRFQALKRSAMFAGVSEAINGIDTALLFNRQEMFVDRIVTLLDDMNSAFFLNSAAQLWLTVRVNGVGFVLTFSTTLLCVLDVFSLTGAQAGLVLSILSETIQFMVYMIPIFTSVENEMTSVERVIEYARDLPEENNTGLHGTGVPDTWPSEGRIEFKHVYMRYREDLSYSLKDFTLSIKPGERIGICGRTGAGKSTILSTIFRLFEINEGSIEIDNINISTVELHRLRTSLCVVPQDPVIFEGTIRSNLDPLGIHEDPALWEALRKVGLSPGEESLSEATASKFSLDREIKEGGLGYSAGERQLFALARAIVLQKRVLVLDEATSNIDVDSDARVRHVIDDSFPGCTVLCIAHRLESIITYDRIIVMDDGGLAEVGTPQELFDRKGIFRQLCDTAGISVSN